VTQTDDGALWTRRDEHAHAVILRVGGAIDYSTVDTLNEQLDAALASVTPLAPVVLDLTAIDFMGSAGLATLITYTLQCGEQGTRLRVIADHRAVLRPITMTGMAEIIDTVPTLEHALRTS
jgi:anti-anti-sigma factor